MNDTPTQVDQAEFWTSEAIYSSAKDFYTDLLKAIVSAKKTVFMETYIFRLDVIGKLVLEALEKASERGVDVRLLVDGVGTYRFDTQLAERLKTTKVAFRIYHPAPWPFGHGSLNILKSLSYINRRNHKKLFIIDGKTAFLGSLNITDDHLYWCDTGVRVQGEGLKLLSKSFEFSWENSNVLSRTPMRAVQSEIADCDYIFLNSSRRLRRNKNRTIAEKMLSAKKRVWLRSPYFLPTPRILNALQKAAQKGIDVRILLTVKSDVPGSQWLAKMFYPELMSAGVKIFEYDATVMHGKSLIVDDWTLVGSSNINHRSLRHDLEVDIVLLKEKSVSELAGTFGEDLNKSRRIIKPDAPFFEWLGGRVLWIFKNWF